MFIPYDLFIKFFIAEQKCISSILFCQFDTIEKDLECFEYYYFSLINGLSGTFFGIEFEKTN
jgi:hypothetical protein